MAIGEEGKQSYTQEGKLRVERDDGKDSRVLGITRSKAAQGTFHVVAKARQDRWAGNKAFLTHFLLLLG